MELEKVNNFNNDDKNGVVDKCKKWLDCTVTVESESWTDDGTSDITSATENSAMESGLVFKSDGIIVSNDNSLSLQGSDDDKNVDVLSPILMKQSINCEKIQIYKSRKVHIGDVTQIKGPVFINNYSPTVHQTLTNNNINFVISGTDTDFPIITRRNWLAQPPMEPKEYLEQPAKFVVLIHSATEEGFTQADNTLMVRLIQGFHIEGRKFSDISYNFLVGADGTVFEGRGWGVKGAFAHKYNKFSVGICLIGCFMQSLPSPLAIQRTKDLIEKGIEINAIAKDYSILAHCQCSPTESPGRKFFKEIQTWDRWNGSITVSEPYEFL